jgi:hypothetical protein
MQTNTWSISNSSENSITSVRLPFVYVDEFIRSQFLLRILRSNSPEYNYLMSKWTYLTQKSQKNLHCIDCEWIILWEDIHVIWNQSGIDRTESNHNFILLCRSENINETLLCSVLRLKTEESSEWRKIRQHRKNLHVLTSTSNMFIKRIFLNFNYRCCCYKNCSIEKWIKPVT